MAEEVEDEFDVPDEVRLEIKTRATEWITGVLLHELSTPIGLLGSTAAREITNYENSTTKQRINSLKSILSAIEDLKGATSTPRPQNFDLSALISETVSDVEQEFTNIGASLVGQKPMMIETDPSLLRLAICNGIKNSFEALSTIKVNDIHPIVITWGETRDEYWVVVLDRGPGLQGPTESAFKIGQSNKTSHSGFGLAIARQAMDTLNGTVDLQPAANGGARYEVRWLK
ncbi:HAMP domain-containing sensor histidine kinase [uncultured Marinobacter sp.]|uniref:sensor histidine kinase n=1 Tax=uncultured Marinobacter sp. TaxID=187379 RepID=UPI002591AA10|nr:HAMP domain-containing sensor histidine kinase [uncultured Marinobacter sp.]